MKSLSIKVGGGGGGEKGGGGGGASQLSLSTNGIFFLTAYNLDSIELL